jgi:hypothetical protein
VDIQRIRKQRKSGYNVITVADRRSPHTADLILVKRSPERRKGTVQGIKTYFQSPESLILAKLRMVKTTVPRERSLKDRDDIRAILANTRVNKRKIIDHARKESTIDIFREILRSTQTGKNRNRAVQPDKRTSKRLKTGDREFKRGRCKVASSRNDIDRILRTRARKRPS